MKEKINQQALQIIREGNGLIELHKAVRLRMHDLIDALVSNGVNVNLKHQNRDALAIACEISDPWTINYLISKGANPTNRTLVTAVCDGFDEITELLLNNYEIEFDINKLLKSSIWMKHPKITQILLDHGARHNISIELNKAFILSIENGLDVVTKMLLDRGANPNANLIKPDSLLKTASMYEDSVLIHAVRTGSEQLAKDLLAYGANPNTKDENGLTALMIAAQNGNIALVKLLLNWVSTINSRPNPLPLSNYYWGPILFLENDSDNANQFQTALDIARHYNQNAIVDILTQWTESPQAAPIMLVRTPQELFNKQALQIIRVERQGRDAVLTAIKQGTHGLLEALVMNGADYHWEYHNYHNALTLACEVGNLRAAQYLLSKGAKLYTSALNGAALNGYADVTQFLLELPRITFDISYALELSVAKNHPHITQTLLDYRQRKNLENANINDAFILSIQKGRDKMAIMLLEHGANANASAPSRRGDEYTVLMWAVREKNDKLAEALLKYGADPDAGHRNDITPLMVAAQIGSSTLVKLLLEKGAQIDRRASMSLYSPEHYGEFCGRTALEIAQKYARNEIVGILEEWAKRPPAPILPAAPVRPVLPRYSQTRDAQPTQKRLGSGGNDFFRCSIS